MFDAKVMHEPSAKFLYEIHCANPACQERYVMVSLSRGVHCPHCDYRDVNCKTFRRLVKP